MLMLRAPSFSTRGIHRPHFARMARVCRSGRRIDFARTFAVRTMPNGALAVAGPPSEETGRVPCVWLAWEAGFAKGHWVRGCGL